MANENIDVEALLLNLSMVNPEHKWPFIRKVYLILTVQFIMTFGVAAAVAFVPSIFSFFSNPWAGWGFYILLILALSIVFLVLRYFKDRSPHNFILLGIFTLCFGLIVGLVTTFISGVVVVESGITLIMVIVSLIAYTFWASWKGREFEFLIPFLLSIAVIVVSYIIFQIYFPMGSAAYVICSGLIVMMFSIFIIVDTETLIKLHSLDQYIMSSITLYLDVLNIFNRLALIVQVCCCSRRDVVE